jgi:nucleoside-diphosphate-sugar epimerase
MLIDSCDRVLVTGAAGFLGSRVVMTLLERGFRNVVCLARPSSDVSELEAAAKEHASAGIEILRGNLLSRKVCEHAAKGAAVIYHLAAGMTQKSFAEAFLHSVVTTRNVLDATLTTASLRRFVSLSSFAVYTNRHKARGRLLDESCPIEASPALRGEAYCFAKVKQDELVAAYGRRHAIPYVLVRPGAVYGPGARGITGRVGTGAFGIFLHLGGGNVIPFTYVDNCAEAVVLAGIIPGIDGETFNVVDDDLPTSRQFLGLYKRHVKSFVSIPLPRSASYAFCALWEKYSIWSGGQLPPVFNRSAWHAYWKGARYENAKAKKLLGWTPRVSTTEGLRRYFEDCRARNSHGA